MYLIDTSAYIHRAFHGLPQMVSPSGEEVGAVYGLTRSIVDLLAMIDRVGAAPFVAAIFDPSTGARHAERRKIDPHYKAHRRPMVAPLRRQIHLAVEAALAMGLGHATAPPGLEADDLIASYAAAATKMGERVMVVSPDKDMLQLVTPIGRPGPATLVFDPMRKQLIEADQVIERFGVGPEMLADFFALVGDAADNVPGVRGVGPKKAAELLRLAGSLDRLLDHPRDYAWGWRLADAIERQRDDALRSRELVRLRTDVPLPVPIESLRWTGFNRETFPQWLNAVGFASIAREAC